MKREDMCVCVRALIRAERGRKRGKVCVCAEGGRKRGRVRGLEMEGKRHPPGERPDDPRLHSSLVLRCLDQTCAPTTYTNTTHTRVSHTDTHTHTGKHTRTCAHIWARARIRTGAHIFTCV